MDSKLTEGELHFLKFINGKSTNTEFSPRWLIYDVIVEQAIIKFKNLNLIKTNLDIQTNINKLTIPQLKELLKSYNLPIVRQKK